MSQTKSITLNNRIVSISDILSGVYTPGTPYEVGIINFIKNWFSENDLFYFQSSGSTGIPKNIGIKRSQIIASIEATASALGLKSDQKALLCIPVSNTGGKMMIARALHLNLSLECIEPSGNPLLNITEIPDFVALVPLQLETIISKSETRDKLNKIAITIVGGAAVNESLTKRLQEVKSRIFATYGMTETVSHIALQPLNGTNKQSHFKLLPNIQIELDARECLKTYGAVTDYQWITTNDRIRLVDNDQFEWLGRIDNVINSGGIKIQSEILEKEIESIFQILGIKKKFFIYGLEDAKLGQKCILVIEGEELDQASLDGLKSEINSKIDKYQKPKEIIFIEEFALTEAGKLNRLGTIKAYSLGLRNIS